MQSMVGVIQCTAEQAFICLFHQLDKVWHIRRTVVPALTSPITCLSLFCKQNHRLCETGFISRDSKKLDYRHVFHGCNFDETFEANIFKNDPVF